MCEGSFLPSSFGPHQKHTEFESSLRSYPINPFALFAKGGQSCGPYHDRHGLVADDSSLTSPTHRKPRWVGQPGETARVGHRRINVHSSSSMSRYMCFCPRRIAETNTFRFTIGPMTSSRTSPASSM